MSETWIGKNTVTGILRSSEAQQVKSFSIGGVGFDPRTFPLLANSIDKGKIKVDDSGADGMAEYDYKTNTIILGFYFVGLSYTRPALILHECTHAVYDSVQTKMSVAISEAIAYVVQCQYIQAVQSGSKRLSSSDSRKDLVFKFAWEIAAKIQAGKKPDVSEKTALLGAVALHPFYKNDSANDAGFNGL